MGVLTRNGSVVYLTSQRPSPPGDPRKERSRTLKVCSLYEFGPFRLHVTEHLLSRRGRPVPLTPKAFDLLVFLLENSGRLVRKDELMKGVWRDSFVEEANLTVNISALRKALASGQGGEEYIETVPRLGYRFNARVEEIEETATAEAGTGTTLPAPDAPVTAAPIRTAQPAIVVEGHTRSQAPGAPVPKKVFAAAAMLGIALIVLASWVYRRQAATRKGPPTPPSLAILPFQNLRQDPDSDFLGLSLADAVITKLGYVSALNVRPSSSIERYRGQFIDARKAARELNVDTLLAGSFLRDGDDLRITAQLVEVKTEKILWKGSFDLKFEKLLTVQDRVAREIIDGLEVTLSPSEVQHLKPDVPVNPLAYEYYLRGVDLYSRNDFPLAIKMLEESGEIDPNYALTWSHLGRSYTANASFKFGGREQYRKAQSAYEKALSLEPRQIEASIYMANLLTDTGHTEQAVPLLQEVLGTNPNHAEAHWELGYSYRFGGLLKESVAECERARQLDPGVKLNSSALNSYLYLGQYDKFLASLPQSDAALILFYRGFGEFHRHNWEQAGENFDRAFEVDASLLQAQVGRALSHGLKHRKSEGLAVLRDTENKIEERGVVEPEAVYKMAQAYAVLGDEASALRVLRRSIENGFFSYPYFRTDPLLDSLRDRSEFTQLMKVARQRHEAFLAMVMSHRDEAAATP
jgi:DNA-binding winged helix-turn-helix (wHTH) protein/TolB-like protein/tetratricopeptide (TPR) repeat protein